MTTVNAHITGVVWSIDVAAGDTVVEGQALVILESMKMEMAVESPVAGTVRSVLCEPGASVGEGTPLVQLDEAS